MPLTPAAQHRPGRRARAAAALALALALAAGTPALAHETDQYTLPVGREFADLGPHFSRIAYDAVDAPTFLASARAELTVTQELWPRIKFHALREHAGLVFQQRLEA